MMKEISSALAHIAHLKDKAFLDCVNDLIERDILVFYDQTPYVDGNLLTDSKITVKSGCLLTESSRIKSQQLKIDLLQKQLEECRYAASELVRVDQLKQGKIAELQSQLAKADELLEDVVGHLLAANQFPHKDKVNLNIAVGNANTYLAQRKAEK